MSDDLIGQLGLSNATSDFNRIWFLVYQMIGYMRTCTIVQIKSVTNAGEVSAVGFVDVLPLVNLVDGMGTPVKHQTVFNLPYFRLQGGQNAIIIDPQVNDIGIAVFADRDISAVKAAKGQANPGSRRRFNWSDGLYVGGVLNGVPNQYVRYNSEGVRVVDKNSNKIEMLASGITLTDCNGNKIEMTSTGIKLTDKNGHVLNMASGGTDVTGPLTSNSTNISNTHVHGGVTTGSGNTAVPH